VRDSRLDYFCNTRVGYTVRGVYVTLNVLWDFEATSGGGDMHFAVFRGTRAQVEVRQGAEQGYRSELYVVPCEAGVAEALRRRVDVLQRAFPGLTVEDEGGALRVAIPDRYRLGHEAHFAAVTRQFLAYLAEPKSLPAWERPNLMAKYHVTTGGVALARDPRNGGGKN
jgi:hypothetical protein